MAELIWKIKGEGDTIGGVVSCVIKGCPIGLGQPVFGKLHAALGNAMLSINAVKGFSYGQGFDSMELKGSEQNDVFYNNNGRVETKSNYSEEYKEASATDKTFTSVWHSNQLPQF